MVSTSVGHCLLIVSEYKVDVQSEMCTDNLQCSRACQKLHLALVFDRFPLGQPDLQTSNDMSTEALDEKSSMLRQIVRNLLTSEKPERTNH